MLKLEYNHEKNTKDITIFSFCYLQKGILKENWGEKLAVIHFKSFLSGMFQTGKDCSCYYIEPIHILHPRNVFFRGKTSVGITP